MSFLPLKCDRAETLAIESIAESEFDQLYCFLELRFGINRQPPSVQVLCLGRAINSHPMVTQLQDSVIPTSTCGIWHGLAGTALVRVSDAGTTRGIIIHEVSHAIIDHLTRGFAFPVAMEEGIVGTAEWTLGERAEVSTSDDTTASSAVPARRWLTDEECIPIRVLLEPRIEWAGTHLDAHEYARIAVVGMWFYVFISRLAHTWHKLDRLYEVVWKQELRRAVDIYGWILNVTGLNADILEAWFVDFCRSGRMPVLPRHNR